MKISLIAAIDEKRGLGKNNDLLFKIPEDLKRFQKLTSGHSVVMGRKTYESIGRPLPNRTNIVITRDHNFHPEGVVVVHSLEQALEEGRHATSSELFILGGGQIFEQAIGCADRIYLTVVKGMYDADVFFPDYSAFGKIIAREDHSIDGYEYTFFTLEK